MPFDDHIPALSQPPADDDSCAWSVISVVDPEGGGADAAFTDGLYTFGRPELLLWARPTDGDDPGADWLLTHADRMDVLGRWACESVEGSLQPGDTREEEFDHGRTTVSFRFGQPASAQAAGADELPPGRPVITIGWSLTRRATPAPIDPASPALRRVNRWISRTEAITANWKLQRPPPARNGAGRPAVWRPAEPITSSRFGPMADWVTARVDQLGAAGQPVLEQFFDRIPAVSLVRCEHCVQERLLILASRHGRGGPAREASNTAELVTMALTEAPSEPSHCDDPYACSGSADCLNGPGSPADCSAALSAWDVEVQRVTRCVPDGLRAEVHRSMRHRLRQSVESVLLAAVVADLVPAALMADACGAWEWAVHDGRVPGRAWLAPASARSTTRDLLTGPDGSSLLLPLVRRGQPIRPGSDSGPGHWSRPGADRQVPGLGSPHDRTAWLIRGLQTMAAGSARPGWLGLGRREGLSRPQVRQAEQLAAPLLTAVALPDELHPDSWQQLTAPLRGYLPSLPEELPGTGLLR